MTPPRISISDLMSRADDMPRTLEELLAPRAEQIRLFVEEVKALLDELESRTPIPEP